MTLKRSSACTSTSGAPASRASASSAPIATHPPLPPKSSPTRSWHAASPDAKGSASGRISRDTSRARAPQSSHISLSADEPASVPSGTTQPPAKSTPRKASAYYSSARRGTVVIGWQGRPASVPEARSVATYTPRACEAQRAREVSARAASARRRGPACAPGRSCG